MADFQVCPDCDGSGWHLSSTIARLRGSRIAFVPCCRCEDGLWPWNPWNSNATVRTHAKEAGNG
jgi:hypothetical protein